MSESVQTAADRLQSIPFDQLISGIRHGTYAADLEAVFGAPLASEIHAMTERRGAMMGADRPLVILLPGIMGSTLSNTMGKVGRIWVDMPAILRGRLRLLTLNDQAEPYDPAVNIQPEDLMAAFYLPMRIHLGWFGGCDVYVFPFDWRYPAAVSVERLRTLVDGLRANDRRRVHLVGHSMGGLVARAYCTNYRDEAARNLAQVIMLGTPNAGSVEAIRNLTVGGAQIRLLCRLTRSDMPLEFARSIPGLYSLMPIPPGGYRGKRIYPFASNVNLFQADTYHITGVSAARLAEAAATLAEPPQELPVPVTIIAGAGVSTSIGVNLSYTQDERPVFDFTSDTTLDGDGTVPIASATALPGATAHFVHEGCHGDLLLYPNVRRAVLMLLHGEDPTHLPEHFERGFMDAPQREEQQRVPSTPASGTLTDDQIDEAAARILDGSPTAEDIAVLIRGW